MVSQLRLSTNDFLGLIWLTSSDPNKKSLGIIQDRLNQLEENFSESIAVKGITFGKSDLIFEIYGKNPLEIFEKIQMIDTELSLTFKGLNSNQSFFTNTLISTRVLYETQRINKKNNSNPISFYIFCGIDFCQITKKDLMKIKRQFRKASIFDIFYTQSMHLLLKIETNDFASTFKDLNNFRKTLDSDILWSTHTFIAIRTFSSSRNGEIIQESDSICALTGLELLREGEIKSTHEIFPVLGSFDYFVRIEGNSLSVLRDEVFGFLDNPNIRATSTFLGLLNEEEE